MPINEILQFGKNGTVEDKDVLEKAIYEAYANRLKGHQPGIADRALMNTTLRQVSHMSAGLAQFIANRHAAGVVDDGDLAKVEAGMLAAVEAVIQGTVAMDHFTNKENPHEVTASQIGAATEDHAHDTMGVDPVARLNAGFAVFLQLGFHGKPGQSFQDGMVDSFVDETGVSHASILFDASKHCYTSDNANNGYNMWSGGDTLVSQSITLAANTEVAKVRALLRRNGSPNAQLKLKIQDCTGSSPSVYPSGTIHKTSPAIDVSTIPQSSDYTWVEFDLAQGGAWTSASSQRDYCFVFEWVNTTSDLNNSVYLGCNSTMDGNVANTLLPGNAARYYGGWEAHKHNDLCLMMFDAAPIPALPTVVSKPFTAVGKPKEVYLNIYQEGEGITLNTDLKGQVSCDGGTTWKDVTLADVGDFGPDLNILNGSATFTDAESGLQPMWKITAEKQVTIHGVAIQWSF